MMQRPWFKIFIWFMATVFFLLFSFMVIAVFSPGPTEQQSMAFMMGMMKAMNSLMGISMSLEHNTDISFIIGQLSIITVPLVLLSIAGAILIRLRGSGLDK